jgi:hypothetical protein
MNPQFDSFITRLKGKAIELQDVAAEMVESLLANTANVIGNVSAEKAAQAVLDLLDKHPEMAKLVLKGLRLSGIGNVSDIADSEPTKPVVLYPKRDLPPRHANGRFKAKSLVARFEYRKDGEDYKSRAVSVHHKTRGIDGDRLVGWDLDRKGFRTFLFSKVRGREFGIKYSEEYI